MLNRIGAVPLVNGHRSMFSQAGTVICLTVDLR